MNMLASAGDDRLFKISNSKDPCTQGVDLSRKVFIVKRGRDCV